MAAWTKKLLKWLRADKWKLPEAGSNLRVGAASEGAEIKLTRAAK
jgi:hypothetical protein